MKAMTTSWMCRGRVVRLKLRARGAVRAERRGELGRKGSSMAGCL